MRQFSPGSRVTAEAGDNGHDDGSRRVHQRAACGVRVEPNARTAVPETDRSVAGRLPGALTALSQHRVPDVRIGGASGGGRLR